MRLFIPNVQKMQKKKDVPGLIKALADKDFEVREVAANALGQVGDVRAVKPLSNTLKNEYRIVSDAAAQALVNIGEKSATTEPLCVVLEYSENSDICQRAGHVLVKIGKLAVNSLCATLKESISSEGKVAAAQALGKINDVRAVEPLLHTLKSYESSVRIAVARALVTIYNAGKLDAQAKQKILAEQNTMAEPHVDEDVSNCPGFTIHHDRGIGVTL